MLLEDDLERLTDFPCPRLRFGLSFHHVYVDWYDHDTCTTPIASVPGIWLYVGPSVQAKLLSSEIVQ